MGQFVPRPLFAALAAGILCATLHAGSAFAAPLCVTMRFFDEHGIPISTPQPVTAIMIGGKPAMDGSIPAQAKMQPGPEVPCPDSLLQIVRSTFEQSCLTEERRNQAAKEHDVPRNVVDKGCADMVESMAPAK